ncbi:hypothetical protein RI367_008079 [Sorochytrium milnesiophthora]
MTVSATASAVAASVVPELLVGTSLMQRYAASLSSASSASNGGALDELRGAVASVADETVRRAPAFSNPRNVRCDMKSLSVRPHDDNSQVKDALRRASTEGVHALNLPALDALNKELQLENIEYNEFAALKIVLVKFVFAAPIDPVDAARRYNEAGIFQSVSTENFTGDGDRLYYVPDPSTYHASAASNSNKRPKPDVATLSQYNQALASTLDDAKKHPQWWFVASHGWGDCTSGCIHRHDFLYAYDRHTRAVSLESDHGDDLSSAPKSASTGGNRGGMGIGIASVGIKSVGVGARKAGEL